MTSERLYYDDSYTVRFAARVAAVGEHQGRPAVELERTYFYPESGGQEADRGMLGDARVVDVQADGGEHVWHVLNAAGAQVTTGAGPSCARRSLAARGCSAVPARPACRRSPRPGTR